MPQIYYAHFFTKFSPQRKETFCQIYVDNKNGKTFGKLEIWLQKKEQNLRGHLILPTSRVGMLPKLRVGKWQTLFLQGIESCRHFFWEGRKVADKTKIKAQAFLNFKPQIMLKPYLNQAHALT